MLKPLLLPLAILCFIASPLAAQNFAQHLQLASLEKAKALLSEEDNFIKALSPFDIQARLGDPKGTKEELMRFIPQQAREFSSRESKKLLKAATQMDEMARQRGWNLTFPDTVFIVKTTGEEEGGAEGYTRGNFIVLNESTLKGSFDQLLHLLAHEAFHILTRHNPDLRKELYAVIGFEVVAPISLAPLQESLITNPDACLAASFPEGFAPAGDAVITLKTNTGQTVRCLMLTYSSRAYSGGSFFKYLSLGFVRLEENRQVADSQGRYRIYAMKEVAPSFFAQVGRNTEYIIHPEEILAENFVMALMGKSGQSEAVLEGVSGVLGK